MATKKTYEGQSVFIVDTCGLFTELARWLVRDFSTVYYWTESKQGGFAHSNQEYIGYGIKGVTHVDDINEYINIAIKEKLDGKDHSIALWVFTWVYDAGRQAMLKTLGCNVFGSGYAESLELDRIGLKKVLKKCGLAVGEHKNLKGFDELIKYAQTPDLPVQYVKLPGNFRANSETFRMENYPDRKDYIEKLKLDAGEVGTIFDITSEDEMPDMVEVGIDPTTVDGKYPETVLCGCEDKDAGYLGVYMPYDKLPEPIKEVSDKMEPALKYFEYRGDISNEMRIGKDLVPYVVDITARSPLPPSFLKLFACRNIAKILMETARGNLITPDVEFKYYIELGIKSDWAKQHMQHVDVPDEVRDNFFFERLCIIHDDMYIIPHQIELADVGSVICGGNTIEKLFKKIEEIGKQLKGSDLDIAWDCLPKFEKIMGKLDELGINFFD